MRSVLLVMLLCAIALAQPPEQIAEEFFNKGNTAYNLGRWAEAIDNFTKAYEAWPRPEFLYNIAQSHRQAGDCKQALYFYKRFRSLEENDAADPLSKKKREEVENFIAQLTDCVANADKSATTKPDTIEPPPPAPTPVVVEPPPPAPLPVVAPKPQVVAVARANAPEPEAPVISARVVAGVAKLALGPDVSVPLQPSLWLAGGVPVVAGPMTLELGAGLSYTPIPSASLTTILANAGASYPVQRALAVRADVGIGGSVLGGVSMMGNPFTRGGAPATGALGMFAVRVGASVDYALGPNLLATITPLAYSYSPANDGLRADIPSVGRFEIAIGLGFRQ